MLSFCSTLILLLIFFGLIQRHNRRIHVPVMLTAFAADVLLVLVIEISRHAVEKAISHTDDSLLMFHVIVSTLTLLLYAMLTFLGFRVLRHNDGQALIWHRKLAYAFILCRLTNYVTSFWVAG